MHRRVLTERHFHLSVREPPFLHRDRPAATVPLPADRPPGVPPCLLYSITADRCCRRDAPQNPHGRPDTLCRSAAPPDQWQKCRLRADLLPGPAAVRRLLPHAVLPGGGPVLPAAEAVPRPGRRPSAPLPAAGSERAGYAASRHPPDDGRRRAGLARRPGLPRFAPAPVLCPASARVLAVFHQGQPAQSALSAAVATVGGSGSLPVILRPDERSEALKVGVNELLSLYGIH
ncbi:hypothetical protein HMPREF9545_03841 [Escherichia coli MS 16-3]|nr:hypothetical protein HMPREF9545_03841 [Escherichia coli MS 16-3]